MPRRRTVSPLFGPPAPAQPGTSITIEATPAEPEKNHVTNFRMVVYSRGLLRRESFVGMMGAIDALFTEGPVDWKVEVASYGTTESAGSDTGTGGADPDVSGTVGEEG